MISFFFATENKDASNLINVYFNYCHAINIVSDIFLRVTFNS